MRPAAALFALVCGCGAAAAQIETADGAASALPAFMQDESDPVAIEMRRIAARMEEAGLELGPVHGGGFLTQREQRTDPIVVPAGTCLTIVALAARGVRDIDATLFAPAGEVLAEDLEPDAHPTIQVCGGDEGRRLYYGLLAYDGAGTYVYASFAGDRESFDRAARILGGRPGVVSSGTERGDQDVRLRELATGVARRGFRTHGEPIPVPLAHDQRVRLPLAVERAHCYTVAAFSMQGLDDVNLRILDELDRELAADASASSDASAQLCVDRDAVLAVEVHASRGEGEARVAFFEAGDASAGGPSGLWLGDRASSRIAIAPLEDAVRADLDAARARGWRSTQRRGEGTLTAGEAVVRSVRLDRGCTLLIASGGRGIGKLALRVSSSDGTVLAEPPAEGSSVDARVCLDERTEASVLVVARRGSGEWALHVLSGHSAAGLPDDAPARVRGGILRAIEDSSGDRWTVESAPRRVTLDPEGTATVPVAPRAGKCARADVASATPVTVDVRRGDSLAHRVHGLDRSALICHRDDAAAARLELLGQAGAEVWVTILHAR